MSDSKTQLTGQVGFGNKSETVINQSIPKGQIVLTEKTYKQNLENAAKAKELELKNLQDSEKKIFLQIEIDEINAKLANMPEALKEAQERIAKLEALTANMANKGAKIEDKNLIDAKNALTRGQVAKREHRLDDAMVSYALAAKLNPSFDILTTALSTAITVCDYSSALSFALDATKVAIKEYGDGSTEHADSLNNLGIIYDYMGQYKKGGPLHEQALSIYKDLLGDMHPRVASSLNNLAASYQGQHKHQAAKPLFIESLEIRQEMLGKEHPDIITSFTNLGNNYYHLGEYEKAESFLNKALTLSKKVLGKTHPTTANGIRDLALLYEEQKRYKEAESFYKQALEMYEKAPVKNQHAVAHATNNLAWLYLITGRNNEAEPLYQQAIEIFETIFGPDHHGTKTAKGSYGIIKKRLANIK